ncbi:hypothetical protein AD930_03935 [Acetobacter malorum]|nr:hypothetical protein AD930_03935 [Acetobacter malorum]
MESCEDYKKKHDKPLYDGEVEWSFNSLIGLEISNVIRLSQTDNQDIKYGTFLSSNAIFYNAIMDFSEAKFYKNSEYQTVLRTKPDTYIDFTAHANLETQNLHILGYDSHEKSLSYKINKQSVLKVKDDGGIVLNSATREEIKNIKNSEDGEIIFDKTDKIPVIFTKGKWLKIVVSGEL